MRKRHAWRLGQAREGSGYDVGKGEEMTLTLGGVRKLRWVGVPGSACKENASRLHAARE